MTKRLSVRVFAFLTVALATLPAFAQPSAAPAAASAPARRAELDATRIRFTDVTGKVYVKLDDLFHPLDGNGDAIGFDVVSRVLASGAVSRTAKNGATTDANGVRRDAAGVLDERIADDRRFDPKTMGFGPGLLVPTAQQAAEMFFGQNVQWKISVALGGSRKTENGDELNPAERQWSDWVRSYRGRDLSDVLEVEGWRKGIASVLSGKSKSKYDVPMLPGHSSTAYDNRKYFDEPVDGSWSQKVASAKADKPRGSSSTRALANGFRLERGIIRDPSGKEIAKLRDDRILTPAGKAATPAEKAKIVALFL